MYLPRLRTLKRVTNPSRRVRQMPAGKPAAPRLHGERGRPDQGLSRGAGWGALVWLLTCKWSEARGGSSQTLAPSFRPHKAQPWVAGGCAPWGTQRPGCGGESQISAAVQLPWGRCLWPGSFPRSMRWECSLCMSVNRGSVKVFEMKKNPTKWGLIGFGLSKIIFAYRHVHIQNSMVDPGFHVLSEFCPRFLGHCFWHHVSIAPRAQPSSLSLLSLSPFQFILPPVLVVKVNRVTHEECHCVLYTLEKWRRSFTPLEELYE